MWNRLFSNTLCNEKERLRIHKVQLERLMLTKPKINIQPPHIPKFLLTKYAQKEIQKNIQNKIAHDNFIIYKKLDHLQRSKSPYSKNKETDFLDENMKMHHKSNYFFHLQKELNLAKDNHRLYKIFLAKKSFYPTKNFLERNNFKRAKL